MVKLRRHEIWKLEHILANSFIVHIVMWFIHRNSPTSTASDVGDIGIGDNANTSMKHRRNRSDATEVEPVVTWKVEIHREGLSVGRKQLENDEFQRQKRLFFLQRFIFSFQLQLQRHGVDRRIDVVKLPNAMAIEVMAKRRSKIARPVQRAYLHCRSSTSHLGNMKNCLVVRSTSKG